MTIEIGQNLANLLGVILAGVFILGLCFMFLHFMKDNDE